MPVVFNPFTGNLDLIENAAAAGSDTQVQFNDGGVLGGDSGLVFNKTTNALTGGAFIPNGSTVPVNGMYLPAANSVALSVSGSEKVRITSDAYVRLASGTGGIQFNGDTAAANALDDYEEGTWTPTVQFGGASVGIAGTFTGTYTKTGNVVTLAFRVEFSSKGTSTGAMTITGLPFSTGVALNVISGFGYIHRLAALQTAGQLYLMPEGTIIYPRFAGYNNGNTTSLTDTHIADTTDLRGGIVYKV